MSKSTEIGSSVLEAQEVGLFAQSAEVPRWPIEDPVKKTGELGCGLHRLHRNQAQATRKRQVEGGVEASRGKPAVRSPLGCPSSSPRVQVRRASDRMPSGLSGSNGQEIRSTALGYPRGAGHEMREGLTAPRYMRIPLTSRCEAGRLAFDRSTGSGSHGLRIRSGFGPKSQVLFNPRTGTGSALGRFAGFRFSWCA
jgi:hypothetical protein